MAAIIMPLVAATIVGLIVLWPRGDAPIQSTDTQVRLRGRVESATPACPRGTPATPDGPCGTAVVRVGDQLLNATVPSGASAPTIKSGDRVVVAAAPGTSRYAVVDHDRSQALLIVVALFAAAVIAFARWRGLTSLFGLAVSFGVLLVFVLPAIQRGESPLPVAIVGSAAIMFAVIYLTHGVSVSTSIAVLGTLGSLVLTGFLGLAVTAAMRLTGSGTDEAAILSNVLSGVDLRGLLLAGIIIGTLGVLDDVTITQTSIVNELAQADPSLSGRQLYTSAIRVGRAHVASVVNTIILAYAGASLPLMLLLVTAGTSTMDVLTTQAISAEIVRSVVGTIGLIAAVPITTALAAWISVKRRISG
ncbi:MAG TPA: YibE/F family protein [Micromonosporaceae bacterium]|nr:YibE/F family protein [Micromonosporaceae bacterium]